MRTLYLRSNYQTKLLLALCLNLFAMGTLSASDWPMWRYDAGRTADSPDSLPKELVPIWSLQYSAREPVWDDPLNQDLMPYDKVFEPVVLGSTMLLAFNDSDKVVALDTGSGEEKWRFYTEGPVRFSPLLNKDKAYFVSDDGHLYCVGLESGELIWKVRGGPAGRKIIGNKRLISSWPARGAPVLRDDVIYFAASIWPMMGTFIYALDAETGEIQWVNDGNGAHFIQQPHNHPAFAGVAPQGALVATKDKLLIPGGRSIPACFDRKTGEHLYYHLAKYGKSGGSSVFANENALFAHDRENNFYRYNLETGIRAAKKKTRRGRRGGKREGDDKKEEKEEDQGDSTRGHQPLLTEKAFYFSGDSIVKRLFSNPDKIAWKLEIDSRGDLIKAGDRIYAAGKNGITALDLSSGNKEPTTAWNFYVQGDVRRLIAADDKLFAVTLDGRILAYGAAGTESVSPANSRITRLQVSAEARRQAREILRESDVSKGYALFHGLGDGDLLAALTMQSDLTIVGVDPDAEKIAQLRRRFDEAGLYGHRVALHHGDLHSFQSPPYMSLLTVIGDFESAGLLGDKNSIQRAFHSLRPYGGAVWIPKTATTQERLSKTVESAGLEKAEIKDAGEYLLLTRSGSLPGAGVWTHQYGDAANTIKSDDKLVKLPLGVLWFGGSSNMDVLPRHGHGPPEQIVGGRLIIQGMDSLSARDVYTGQVLWKERVNNSDIEGIYYDQTYENTPTNTKYNQVHIPGANARGTNYVATEDRVYMLEGPRCRVLDAATGRTLDTISLPNTPDGRRAENWGYIGVYKDNLIAGAGFANYNTKLEIELDKTKEKSKFRFEDYDKTGSMSLVVMDRITGKERWRIDAQHGFIHNAIAIADETLYCLDKYPVEIERRLKRRGEDPPETYRLLALDMKTGEVRWEKDSDIFGTWLSCSEEQNILLQSTRPSRDTVKSEDGKRMIAYNASSGEILWDENTSYSAPPILHGDKIISAGKMLNMKTGEPVYRIDPLTGLKGLWSYKRGYGCNYPIASENLLSFRSTAAGFYDLLGDSGTGHFGGFKGGCTSNLIAADGVLNAPDYTRTCSCAYQNQTSLALVHIPDLELWTHNDYGYNGNSVNQIGINFGAPGDRRDDNGTLWVDFPSVGGPSPDVEVFVEGNPTYFRRHSSQVSGEGSSWIAASGVSGASKITLRIEPSPSASGKVDHEGDDAEENAEGKVSIKSSDLELTKDTTTQNVGLRFSSLAIPPGSKIKSAYIKFDAKDESSEVASLTIAGEATDNASRFEAKDKNISSRKKTKAAVSWKPNAWKKSDTPEEDLKTPDLSKVLQEIVDRPGWKYKSAAAFLISGSGDRNAISYDGDSKKAPRLVVELEEIAIADVNRVPERNFTVRLHFVEPVNTLSPGERVFDVIVQGKTLLKNFDVAEESGAAQRSIVKQFSGIPLTDELQIELKPLNGRPAVLSGVEIIAENL